MPADPKFAVIVLTAPPQGLAHLGTGGFDKVGGRECLLRSVELFVNRDNVVQILLGVDTTDAAKVKERFGPNLSFSGVKLAVGGPRWVDQVAAAAPLLSPEATHVILHDAARPVVPFRDIESLMVAAADHPAVALAKRAEATLVETDDGGQPVASHLPTAFRQLLTPQAFDRATFEEMARSKAEVHPSKLTLLDGAAMNVRACGPGPVAIANALVALLPKPKVKSAGPFDEAQW
jgi:2-C-methyl-D-erythritol 4-phosphate cytidylyltransferase